MKRGKDRGKYFMVSLFLQQLYRDDYSEAL